MTDVKNYSVALALAITLASCGTLHVGSKLEPGTTNVATVTVKDITVFTLSEANSAPFKASTLPAAFKTALPELGEAIDKSPAPQLPAAYTDQPRRLFLNPPPNATPGPYRLGTGDVVLIATPKVGSTVEQLSGLLAAENARQGYTIQDGGYINVPNVGRVVIGGLTIDEAQEALFTALVDNNLEPAVSLEVSEFNSKRITIGGAVTRPTVVPITLTPLYLDAALSAAGGANVQNLAFASVRLLRDGAMYQIPLVDLYQNDALLKTRLVDGDAIFIDTEYNIAEASRYFEQQIRLQTTEQAAQEFALRKLELEANFLQTRNKEAREQFAERDRYGAVPRSFAYLTGEVSRQSKFELPFERTASLAETLFSEAGGINLLEGNVAKVYVLRSEITKNAPITFTAWQLDASNAASYAVATKFEMRPDDVVYVATQPVTRWSRVMSQILPGVDVFDGTSAIDDRSFQ